jgi:aminopeptidase
VVDPRIEKLAGLLVERCIDVQPGWQVLVHGNPAARPLLEEVCRRIGRRGAYALVRVRIDSPPLRAWMLEVDEAALAKLTEIEAHEFDAMNTYIVVEAPENTRDGSEVPAEKLALRNKATRPHMMPIFRGEKPWVGLNFPTPALAQDAGMTLAQFEDFYWGAMLVDWEALAAEMRRIADRFDAADEVRIIGDGTDLRFSLAGRHGLVDALSANMPGGEVFYSPVEDSAEGVITYSEYPACYLNHEVGNVRFRFEGGKIVEASASSDEEFLLGMLDADEGARRLGEFGIGCNPGIQSHMRNTLFDEKIEGTIHLAIGQGFPYLGGSNESAVHWDMVKELRPGPEPHHRAEPDGAVGQCRGGRIELDGELVQENGTWLL